MGLLLILSLLASELPAQEAVRSIDPLNQAIAETTAAPLKISVRVPRRTSVGGKKAGLFCLPKGNFRIEDFVSSEAFLRTVILDAFSQEAYAKFEILPVSISLTEVKVSLCAKDNLFNGDLYSGKARFTFVVISQGGVEATQTIELEIEKSQARSAHEILELAADRLAEAAAAEAASDEAPTPAPAQ